jgi:hypothetical protein
VPGRKQILLDDWLLGSSDKRPVLEALFEEPHRSFTPSELARAAHERQKNRRPDGETISRTTVRKPLAALIQLGMVEHEHGRYRVSPSTPQGEQLALVVPPLLKVLDRVPHSELQKLADVIG